MSTMENSVAACFARNNNRKRIEQLPKMHEMYSRVWDLNDPEGNIGIGLRLISPECPIMQYEELNISYGGRRNSYFIVRYGFAVPQNPFDIVRRSNLTINTFVPN